MVFMWSTNDQVGFTRGAKLVLSTSMWLRGRRKGVKRCSLAVRKILCSFDQGKVI